MTWKLAWKHLKTKPFLSFFTLLAMVSSLTVLGVFWTLVENLDRVQVVQSGNSTSESQGGLAIFVDSVSGKENLADLKAKLANHVLVDRVEWISSEEAISQLEGQFGETLARAFTAETLPLTGRIFLKQTRLDQGQLSGLMNEFRSLPGVLDVDEGLRFTSAATTGVGQRIFSWASVLLVMIFLIVALLVSHLVRIAFETLRTEIETLKVLGASALWIFRPLILEGVLFGVTAGLLSLVVLAFLVNAVFPQVAPILLPKGMSIELLSLRSSLLLGGVSLAASLLGAIFTWPLLLRAPKEV